MKLMVLAFSIDPCYQSGDLENYYQTQYLKGHVASLEKIGWEIDVFTDQMMPGMVSEEKIGQQSRVIRVKVDRGVLCNDCFTYLPDFLIRVKKWIQENAISYSLIHSINWLSGWIGRQLQQDWSIPHVHVPFTLGVYVQNLETTHDTNSALRIMEETKTFASADVVVAMYPEEREAIWRRYGLRSVDVQINSYGVNTSLFHSQGGAKAERARGKRIILYTGGLQVKDGLCVLVESLRELLNSHPRIARTIELWILGTPSVQDLQENMDGQQLGQLAHVLAYGEFVRFLGMPSTEKMAEYYRTADLCIVPSAANGLGMAALEAMAGSCPIVALRSNCLRHIVLDGETGVLVPVNDSRMLAQAIERLLTNPALRKRMGQRAVNWVRESFDYINIGKRWDSIYREVLYQQECVQHSKTDSIKLIC